MIATFIAIGFIDPEKCIAYHRKMKPINGMNS